jgi:hypothetical protein
MILSPLLLLCSCEKLPFTAVREIKYLQMLSDNPNVIKLEGTFFTRGTSWPSHLILVARRREESKEGSSSNITLAHERRRRCVDGVCVPV